MHFNRILSKWNYSSNKQKTQVSWICIHFAKALRKFFFLFFLCQQNSFPHFTNFIFQMFIDLIDLQYKNCSTKYLIFIYLFGKLNIISGWKERNYFNLPWNKQKKTEIIIKSKRMAMDGNKEKQMGINRRLWQTWNKEEEENDKRKTKNIFIWKQ